MKKETNFSKSCISKGFYRFLLKNTLKTPGSTHLTHLLYDVNNKKLKTLKKIQCSRQCPGHTMVQPGACARLLVVVEAKVTASSRAPVLAHILLSDLPMTFPCAALLVCGLLVNCEVPQDLFPQRLARCRAHRKGLVDTYLIDSVS